MQIGYINMQHKQTTNQLFEISAVLHTISGRFQP